MYVTWGHQITGDSRVATASVTLLNQYMDRRCGAKPTRAKSYFRNAQICKYVTSLMIIRETASILWAAIESA
jgi:hypothetical protein